MGLFDKKNNKTSFKHLWWLKYLLWAKLLWLYVNNDVLCNYINIVNNPCTKITVVAKNHKYVDDHEEQLIIAVQ